MLCWTRVAFYVSKSVTHALAGNGMACASSFIIDSSMDGLITQMNDAHPQNETASKKISAHEICLRNSSFQRNFSSSPEPHTHSFN